MELKYRHWFDPLAGVAVLHSHYNGTKNPVSNINSVHTEIDLVKIQEVLSLAGPYIPITLITLVTQFIRIGSTWLRNHVFK